MLKTPEENKSYNLKKDKMPITFASNSKSWEHDLPGTGNTTHERKDQKEEENLNFENYLKDR